MQNAKLHHVGFLVKSIKKEVFGFQKMLEASWDGAIIHDPLQKVRVTFLRTANSTDAQIELVEPDGEESPVIGALNKGGGLHHLCYEVPDLEAALQHARANKGFIVKSPQPAAAFHGRRIAWILTAQKLLVEYLEQENHPDNATRPEVP
jgi:methylmalonyl-CoA/ethylmalonyl-CoA epimerase